MHYAFRVAGIDAGVRCTPHDLRRTATTWLLQKGVDPWSATGYLGVTLETMQAHYAKHSPEHLASVAWAMGYQSPAPTVRQRSE